MGRSVIGIIVCRKCKRTLDVATEDIEWERLQDMGECDEDSASHDFGVFQDIECKYCNEKHRIIFKAKGKSMDNLDSCEIIDLNMEN